MHDGSLSLISNIMAEPLGRCRLKNCINSCLFSWLIHKEERHRAPNRRLLPGWEARVGRDVAPVARYDLSVVLVLRALIGHSVPWSSDLTFQASNLPVALDSSDSFDLLLINIYDRSHVN